MKNYFWSEVIEQRRLQFFGFFLACSHLLTFYRWHLDGSFASLALGDGFALCWPFFKECDSYRSWLHTNLTSIIGVFGFVSFGAVIAFLFRRPRVGLVFFAVATILRAAIFLGDYRLMGNYHYMFWWMTAAFIFLPHKELVARVLLVCFYFFAGLLKLNAEWLGGHALNVAPILEGGWLTASLFYVIVLELLIVPLALSSSRTIQATVWVQLMIFHIFSWHIVGYFYPLTMLCLSSILILPGPRESFWHGRRVVIPISVVFLMFQLVPRLIPGNEALSGEGRFFSLTMLDAKVQCVNNIELSSAKKNFVVHDPLFDLETRIRCDPYVHLQLARKVCATNPNSSVQLELKSKQASDSEFITVASLADVCIDSIDYRIIGRNDWIFPNEAGSETSPANAGEFRRKENVVERVDEGGATLWQTEFWAGRVDGLEKIYPGQHGLVAVLRSQRVVSLNLLTGKAVWVSPYGGLLKSNSLSDGDFLYLHSVLPGGQHQLAAISLRTGDLAWRYSLPMIIEEIETVRNRRALFRGPSGNSYQVGIDGVSLEGER